MNATYLTGERVALRAMRLEDREHAVAWFPGPFPVHAERAEEFLREELKQSSSRRMTLAVVRVGSDDDVVGGVRILSNLRRADIQIQIAPLLDDGDELRGQAIRLLVPWLRDEGQHITVNIDIAADQPATIAAAEAAGMVQTARLREWYARPGGRADRLVYQALNLVWEREQEAPSA